ncbi:MAG: Hit-like protein involved in cell-cycle regulation [Microgenomates group bacterium Gr01-1014_16]|nr:MAG: Hit-like protein involved in cell-cycle regulation [Microgenomates group bacterium Gr01-1014_16]
MDCVFCEIAGGGVAADKIFEDEEMVVFPDKNPGAPVHLLFVSKKHGEEFHTVEPAKLEKMLGKVREKIVELGVPYRVALNGMGATQIQDHLHIHLLGKVSAEKPV